MDRMRREAWTVQAMIGIYCRGVHRTEGGLDDECRELLDYALTRLEKCPFQEGKTTCANCPVHCYKPEMREKIREVMRYAGPRMSYRHPILAARHFLDSRRKEPLRSATRTSEQPRRLSETPRQTRAGQ